MLLHLRFVFTFYHKLASALTLPQLVIMTDIFPEKVITSGVVQWSVYLPVTQVTRVRFPALELF